MRSKKMLFLFAVVILVASGYGVLLYVENAVVAAVRSVEKNTSPRISFGNVQFSLLNRQLTLTDVRVSDDDGSQEHPSYAVRRATAIVPLSLLFNTPDAPTLLASEYVEHGTTVRLNMGDAENPHILTQTFDSSRTANLRGNPRRLLELLRSDQSLLDTLWDIIAHTAYDNAIVSGIGMEAPAKGSTPAMRMHIDQFITGPFRNMEFQHLQQLGWQLFMADREIWRLDELNMKNARLPSLRAMKMMEELQQQQRMSLERDEAQMDALWEELLLGPTPPIEQILLKGLVVDPKGWGIRLKAFTLDGPFTEPMNASFRIESLSLPTELLLTRFPLQLPGLKRLDFDVNAAVHKDAAGLFKEQFAVSLRDVGNLQCAVTARAAQNTQGIHRLWGNLTHVLHSEVTFEDKNLLAYLGGNVDPDGNKAAPVLYQAAALILQEYWLFIPPAAQQQLKNFIDQPGTLKVIFAPKDPMPVRELRKAPQAFAPALDINATPGTTPLEQQIQKLFAPKDDTAQ